MREVQSSNQNSFFLFLLRNWGLSGWLVLSFFIVTLMFVILPPMNEVLTSVFRSDKQIILSVAENKFSRKSPIRQVIKLQTPSGILLEVYGIADKDGNRQLLEIIRLPDRHDAYFDINGRATNLAFRDMNNDGTAELIAPSYDDDWNPRLNVFTYDRETESLRPLNE